MTPSRIHTSELEPDNEGFEPSALTVHRASHPGWWFVSAAILAIVGYIVAAFVTTPNIAWDVAFGYLFSPRIIAGIGTTLWLTAVCLVIGIVLGLVLALMRLSPLKIPAAIAGAYVWLFRSVPVLLQLIIWFNLGLVFPHLGIGIPFTDLFWGVPTNDVITALTAAVLGLGLNEAAYMAEIIRAGIRSVDDGQVDASRAIGMSPWKSLTKIILPQAIRVIIPPAGNEVILLLKGTSLVVVLGVADLLNSARHIYAANLRTMELLFVASAWYLALVGILSLIQMFLEKRSSRGYGSARAREPKDKSTDPLSLASMRNI